MTSQTVAMQKAINDAWNNWIAEHERSVSTDISHAVEKAVNDWLTANNDELLDRIATRTRMFGKSRKTTTVKENA